MLATKKKKVTEKVKISRQLARQRNMLAAKQKDSRQIRNRSLQKKKTYSKREIPAAKGNGSRQKENRS